MGTYPTALSNEIVVNVDSNFFIAVFKAKYAVRTLLANIASM
jgi:hypothetical protein